MYKLLATFIIVLTCQLVMAQKEKHWIKQLYTSKESKLQAAIELREIYLDTEPDSILSIGTYLVNEGLNNNHPDYVAYGKLLLSIVYNSRSKTDLALRYLFDAEKYYLRKEDHERLSDVQNQLGITYIYKTDYEAALSWFIKSIKSGEMLGADNESYMGQINLSEVYIRQGKYDLAEAEVFSFLEKVKKQGLEDGERKAYTYLTKIYLAKGDLKLASQYANKTLEYSLRLDSKHGKANAYNNMAIVYFELGEPDLALEHFYKALKIREELRTPKGISESYYNLGDWHFYMENLPEALKFYQTSLEIATKAELIVEQSDAYERLAQTYELLGDWKKTAEFQKKYIQSIKKVHNQNKNKEMDFQRVAYELDRLEQLTLQKRREDHILKQVEDEQGKGKIVVMSFSFALILLVVWQFISSTRFKKAKKEVLEKQLKRTQTDKMKLQTLQSRWDRLNHFSQSILTQQRFIVPFQLWGNMFVLPLGEGKYFLLELHVTKLEAKLFFDYLRPLQAKELSEEMLFDLLKKQSFIPFNQLPFAIYNGFNKEIRGYQMLALHGDGSIQPLLDDFSEISDRFILISSTLKKELESIGKWDEFLNQFISLNIISDSMARVSFGEKWSAYLDENQLGTCWIS